MYEQIFHQAPLQKKKMVRDYKALVFNEGNMVIFLGPLVILSRRYIFNSFPPAEVRIIFVTMNHIQIYYYLYNLILAYKD